MKVYIAAKFTRRLEMRTQADRLWKLGFEITGTWLQETARASWMSHDEFWRKLAMKDLAEIAAADILILDTAVASETGGKEVEFGFALGQWHNKLLFVVGPERNVFHLLADQQFSDWDTCVAYLEQNYQQFCSSEKEGNPVVPDTKVNQIPPTVVAHSPFDEQLFHAPNAWSLRIEREQQNADRRAV